MVTFAASKPKMRFGPRGLQLFCGTCPQGIGYRKRGEVT